jgi:predicted  nucleic acid-binding Zn-ribbon protein
VTSVVALLLGFGIGTWATHPSVTKAQSQRDTARQHLATTNKQLATTNTQMKSLQDQLTAANAKVQSCQSLSTTATKLFKDWDSLVAASHAFDATAPGSAAETQAAAELDRQFRSLDLEMQSAKQALAQCAPASNA